jgi:predicted nucleic acid-binding protein
VICYLDTSSLVKLYVLEQGAPAVRSLVENADLVATSVMAYAEARAAFARRARERGLTRTEHRRVCGDLESDWPFYLSIEVTQAVSRHAGDVAEKHALRGVDALHLATFLALLARMQGQTVRFSSFDARLNAAATRELRAAGRAT